MTSRYNVYFYARESLKEGVTKLEENHKDDYTMLLPLYIYGTKESSKEIFPEMDRVIKKSSVCITRHAIKDKKTKAEVVGAVKWIDNAWMALGKAHFYKREFFSAIETFDYVASTYKKSKERYEAWMWLIKTYNEMGLLSQSEPYINLIKNEKNFPKQFKSEFEALHAEFYIKQGLHEEAIKKLTEAISHTKNKKTKARFYFILGQLYEEQEENKKAISNYKKTLAKKPAYEMVFNTRMKLALLAEYTPATAKKLKHELLKMLKDIKNDEYLDVIYYTLGQLEERDKNYDLAFDYYKKSVSKSTTNVIQKSKSYLRIADMSFDREDYIASKSYYDSTLAFMKEDNRAYKTVVNKQKSLDVLVGHITTIKTQDSLLKIANMDSSARNAFIKKMITKLEEDEKKAKELKEQQLADNLNPDNNGNNANNGFQSTAGNTGAWYFYNPQTKAFGVNDFIKKWGNQRKNEDNWRRLNKQSTIDPWQNGSDSTGTESDSLKTKKDSIVSNVKSVAYYLQNVPLTKSLQDSAHKKILYSYYSLGTIYREQLNNNKRSINTFIKMNSIYPKNEFECPSNYQMYRVYLQEKNQSKAEECKNVILSLCPESDYAQIIKDPNFANAVNAKKSEMEAFYTKTYNLYIQNSYPEALSNCNEALRKYSKNEFSGKFAYIRALCIGKTKTVDSLEIALKQVVAKYPEDAVSTSAKAMLDAIQKAKNPGVAKDSVVVAAIDPNTYKVKDSTEHYWVVSIPQNRGDVNAFKVKLSNLNKQYFSLENYQIQTMVISTETLVLVKMFKNKGDVVSYNDFIVNKPDIFSGLQKQSISVFCISSDNMILLLKKKVIADYKKFHEANYVTKKPL